MNTTIKNKKRGGFSQNSNTNSLRQILKTYLNKTQKSNNSISSNTSSFSSLFYKADVNQEIDNIKKIYDVLLHKLEEYIKTWNGNIKKELNDLIKQIILIQNEILMQCKHYKENNNNINCSAYIEKFINQIDGEYGYKNRVERIIENIENIKSPMKKTKKNKKRTIQKRGVILILEHLLEEIDTYANNIKKL